MIHLRGAGSSLVLDARGTDAPAFVHWGRDLGNLSHGDLAALADALIPAVANSAPALPLRASVLPMLNAGWQGRPALAGHYAETTTFPEFSLTEVRPGGSSSVGLSLTNGRVVVELHYELTVEGLLKAGATVTNVADETFDLTRLSVVLPLPDRASEVLDFAGTWSGERRPQRHPLHVGEISRETRHGRPGHDSPWVMAAGTDSFGFGSGEVWAAHLGWSGDQHIWVERQSTGLSVIGAGELLDAGEVRLSTGQTYETPSLYASWSDRGLDGISERFHGYLRREREFDRRAHPLILNTWEAVYFDHDADRLRALARAAAAAGVERFVLDDGWMSGRVDDAHGLGDWTVDSIRRPEGLGPLIAEVNALGLEFGLWVEPEMLNLDSEVAREHPEWILSDVGHVPLASRNQFVLDLSQHDAFDHVLAQLDALLDSYAIVSLKWDHNRDLLTTRTRDQVLAVYALMDELARRHPQVEIESCAAGGARIDFEILRRTTRVWGSDTNDALERQRVYRWTSLLVPPELIGVHLGAATAHITGRTHALSFRLATALFGWSGIEWDLTRASADEADAVATWVAVYKRLRGILHSGTVVRADREDATWVHGIVARDLAQAVFTVAAMDSRTTALPAPIRFPGLDSDRMYEVRIVDLGARPRFLAEKLPPWMTAAQPIRLSGAQLGEVGIAAPPLAPEQAIVLELSASASA